MRKCAAIGGRGGGGGAPASASESFGRGRFAVQDSCSRALADDPSTIARASAWMGDTDSARAVQTPVRCGVCTRAEGRSYASATRSIVRQPSPPAERASSCRVVRHGWSAQSCRQPQPCALGPQTGQRSAAAWVRLAAFDHACADRLAAYHHPRRVLHHPALRCQELPQLAGPKNVI